MTDTVVTSIAGESFDAARALPAADRGAGTHAAVLRVVVADDHPLFRQAICAAIGRHPGLALVGEAADGDEAVALIDALQPDVAVLDHRMPGLTGAEVCRALHERDVPSATALLMLSAFEDTELVWDAASGGAAGYIGKTASQTSICDAIEQVGRGGLAFTETTGRAIAEGFAQHFGSDGARRGS
jgi:two-component system nitrate/nitrite response regulator NarL